MRLVNYFDYLIKKSGNYNVGEKNKLKAYLLK